MLVDDLLARRVVFGRGHPQRGPVGKLDDTLDTAFSKRSLADDDGAVEILQCAGNNLRGAGAAVVDEDGERELVVSADVHGAIDFFLRRDTTLGVNDHLARRQKLAAHFHGALEQATGIVPEIHDGRLRALGFKLVEALAEFVRGRLVELRNAHVGDLVFAGDLGREQFRILHARDPDDLAREGVIFDVVAGRAQDRERDLPADFAPELRDGVVHVELFRGLSIDFQNLIAWEQAGLEPRRVFHRRDNGEHAIAHGDDDAEAAELAPGVVLHILVADRLHELAVRIEIGHHAAQRAVDEVVVADFLFVHVILPDEQQRAGEDRDLVVGGFLGRGEHGGRHRFVNAHPEKPESQDKKNTAQPNAPFHGLRG